MNRDQPRPTPIPRDLHARGLMEPITVGDSAEGHLMRGRCWDASTHPSRAWALVEAWDLRRDPGSWRSGRWTGRP